MAPGKRTRESTQGPGEEAQQVRDSRAFLPSLSHDKPFRRAASPTTAATRTLDARLHRKQALPSSIDGKTQTITLERTRMEVLSRKLDTRKPNTKTQPTAKTDKTS